MPILFCNIAWMTWYDGLRGTDIPLGGGRYVRENARAGEVCNFTPADDGRVYGHFETIKGERDRKVRLEYLGATKDAPFVDDVDVVWTAPLNGNEGRRVIGWYRSARVFRERQKSNPASLSAKHARDGIDSWRVTAGAADAVLLSPDQRDLVLGRGPGWSGQASWWYAEESSNPQVKTFLRQVRDRMEDRRHRGGGGANGGDSGGGAATTAYQRYMREFEITVHPRHAALQSRFVTYLKSRKATKIHPDVDYVDVRYEEPSGRAVFAEIKPTYPETTRFAIRTALGQLFDYRQKHEHGCDLLIVVEQPVTHPDDLALAFDNGAGLAWPTTAGFEMLWPASRQ